MNILWSEIFSKFGRRKKQQEPLELRRSLFLANTLSSIAYNLFTIFNVSHPCTLSKISYAKKGHFSLSPKKEFPPKCVQILTSFSEIQQKNMCTDELFYPTNSARVFRVGSSRSRWPDFLVRCHHTTAEEEGAGLKGAVDTWCRSIAVTISLFLSGGGAGWSFSSDTVSKHHDFVWFHDSHLHLPSIDAVTCPLLEHESIF